MQQRQSAKSDNLSRSGMNHPTPHSWVRWAPIVGLVALVIPFTGCGGPEAPPQPGSERKPYLGVVLRVSCPDTAFAAELDPLAKVWAARTGATVEVVPTPMAPADTADIGI